MSKSREEEIAAILVRGVRRLLDECKSGKQRLSPAAGTKSSAKSESSVASEVAVTGDAA